MSERQRGRADGYHEGSLRCDEARVLLMGFLDGELDTGQRQQLEDHLAVCVDCRSEERAYRRLGELTEDAAADVGPGSDPDAVWAGIYARIERRIGWVLTGIGLTIVGLFGLWELVRDLLLSPDTPLILRVGLGTLTVGVLLLAVSFVRERWVRNRTERYREVRR